MQSTRKVIDFKQKRQTSSPRKKPKILFVDDEERILNTMQALFRRQYDTTTTTDGYHALELLRQDNYQLLVSDQRMPIMAGVDLLREAKNVSPDTIRILLTGYSDLTAIIGSVNDGEVFRFLNKPWDTQEFVTTVNEAVQIGVELQAANDASATPSVVQLPTEELDEQTQTVDKAVPPSNPAPQAETQATAIQSREEVTSSVATIDEAHENIIVLRGDHAILSLVRDMLPGCQIFEAENYDDAIDLMLQYEIGVIISNLNEDHESALEFFSLLKNEHPQIVSVLLADSGDSTTLIHLINHARIFRYMFKPIREKLMHRFLNSALEQYRKFKTSPTLLKQQRAQKKPQKPDNPTSHSTSRPADDTKSQSSLAAQGTTSIRGKMKKIRSFFSRLVSG